MKSMKKSLHGLNEKRYTKRLLCAFRNLETSWIKIEIIFQFIYYYLNLKKIGSWIIYFIFHGHIILGGLFYFVLFCFILMIGVSFLHYFVNVKCSECA